MMSPIAPRIAALLDRIRRAELAADRPPGSVKLVAVSKSVSPERMADAYREGLRDFGESYVQEAIPKLAQLRQPLIVWHFIGPIQSNKTRLIAEHFDWVHSVDRIAVADRLSRERPEGLSALNVCIQINVSGERSKAGVSIADLPDLAKAIAEMPRLRLRGLMAIPAPEQPFERQRAAFRQVREALAWLPQTGADTLSMGMSDDFEAAIMEGATLIRVGSALFGPRAMARS
jgi:pyridoxal phosphate enzyme (YggS family)